MIISSSITQYNTSDIKRALDTKITEFSSDGYYDYLSFPSYNVELPSDAGPFWKRDTIVIKWDYSEPLNDLIPFTNIYLVSGSSQKIIKRNVKTSIKNINYNLPSTLKENMKYHFKVASMFEGQEVFDTSSVFTVQDRYVDILTNSPTTPIIANQGKTFTIDWEAFGTSDYFKIQLLQFLEGSTITIDGNLGQLIGDPSSEPPIALNGDPSNPVVIATLEPKKYIAGTDKSYTWTINNIPMDVDNVRLKVIDSYNPHAYDYTEPIPLLVPYIALKNFMGRLVGPPAANEVTYSGQGDAILSLYAFNPQNRTVPEGSLLEFSYNTTNARKVYLTKKTEPNYNLVFNSVNGTHIIRNIMKDEIYTVNAEDVNNKIRKASFNVNVELENTTNEIDITKFSLLELLNYSIALGDEALVSGDTLIEPGAEITYKINYYKIEAGQMNEATDYGIVKKLLTHVNDDIIVVLYNGVETSPKVYLGAGNLWDRVVGANVEIAKRLGVTPLITYRVSGKILSGSAPIAGVNIHFDSEGGNTETLADGTYTKQLSPLYTGTVTPSKAGYTFAPADKSYVNLKNNLANENYTAKSAAPPPPPPSEFVEVTVDFEKQGTVQPPSQGYFIKVWSSATPTDVKQIVDSGKITYNLRPGNINLDLALLNSYTFVGDDNKITKNRTLIEELPYYNMQTEIIPAIAGDKVTLTVTINNV